METKSKDIKKSLKISGIVVGTIILFVSTIFFLLQTSRVQQLIAQVVVRDLSSKVQSEIRIGKVEYKFFNTISLQDVYVKDLQQDTLLHIQDLNARFSLFRFFSGKIIFHSADFNELYANLSVDKSGETNFKFLIDAFSKPDTEKQNNDLEYKIKHLSLKNSSIQFRNFKNQTKEIPNPDNQLNFNRLYFDKINTELALNVLNKDSLNAEIVSFSGEEKSGLKLVELKTSIVGSDTQIEIPDFNVLLPDSRLYFSNIALKYDSLPDFAKFPEKVYLQGKLHSSYLKLDDISPLIPQMKNMQAVANLETTIDGQLSNLHVRGFKIQYGESFVLNGNLDLNGLPDLEQTFIYGNLKELRLNANDTEKFISDLIEESYRLPDAMKQLGTIQYQGNITGFFSNLVMYGKLKTNIGSVSTDILLQLENNFRDLSYNGTLKSSSLDLGQMLQTENVGNIEFYFNTTGSRKMNSMPQGTIDANVTRLSLYGYEYHDIRFNGDYDGNGFNGKLKIEDENINANFNGLIDMSQELPVFDFELFVRETNLNALHFTEKYPDSKLSFNAKTNMTGNSLDNINGFFRIDSIAFVNNDKVLDLNEINFLSRTSKDYTNFSIESEYLNGSISGNFKYSKLLEISTQILKEYIPSVNDKKAKKRPDSHIDIDLTLSNTERLSEVLDMPYKLIETAQIKGSLNETDNLVDIVASAPKFISGEQQFNNTTLHVWSESQKLEVILESNIPTENDYWNIALYSAAQKDSLIANLEWKNRQRIVNKGEFKTLTRFSRNKEDKIIAGTSILPSEIIISDSIWNLNANVIEFEKGIVHIDDFRFGNEQQYLNIDGVASKSQDDSLKIEMKEINLDFISTLANMKGFRIGGITTGNATILSVFEQPVFDAVLSVADLKLNQVRMGDASIFSTWDQANAQVVAIASIKDGDEAIAMGECTYKPSENTLDVILDANRVKLDFLSRYYEKILPNTTGFVSGKLKIGGPLNEIRFDGRLKVDEGQVKVGMLGSTFYFNDTIVLEPNSIRFPNITMYDVEKNKLSLDGALNHNGKFKNFRYNLNIQTANAQVVNLQAGANDLFFGKAYAEATVRITGTEDDVSIRVNALTKPGTKVYIQTGGSSEATDAGFIHFVRHHSEDEELLYIPPPRIAPPSSTITRLNLQIEATPAAEVNLIIDPVSGDMISGKGAGNIRIEYDSSQSDTKMYGNYTLESGNYLFTLQDVFRKEFKIESGSSVYWTGSPSNAQVNIRAIYSLTASLKDLLDEDLLNSVLDKSSRVMVPVNCILILTDNLMSPTIKFDIDLPSSDEGVKQVVRNVINTDEMLTQQILYLLLFNKFYMPNNQNIVSLGSNELWSLTASTVSAQLNNLVSQFSNSNSLSLGFDIRRVNEVDWEYQLDLLYQPNDRLIVSGNLGYRNNRKAIENYNQYITDVDIEYLLTESGKLRVKFYSHTIDRTAQLRAAKNTQGIGFVYRENFDSVGDMFRYYWRILAGKNRKEKKENEENNTDD